MSHRRRSYRKRWILPVVGLLLVGWWLFGRLTAGEASVWTQVERGDLVLGVDVTGTLRAAETSTLGPPQLRDFWEFKIAHMAPEGEQVEAGSPVLGFDTTELQQRLERQLAEADTSRKQIEKTEKSLSVSRGRDALRMAEAEAKLRRTRLVVERPGELSSSQELEVARLDLELAEIEVDYLKRRILASERSAQAQLAALRNQQGRAEGRVEEIKTAMAEMMRMAPRDGTVIYTTNWRDEKKKVGDTCWRGQGVIELPDLTTMEAEGWVEESDAGRLTEQQEVTFRLDAHPDDEFEGTIRSIWRTVQRQSHGDKFKSARLQIELATTDQLRMRPGMRFRGSVEIERIRDTPLIPIEAVFLTDAGPVVHRKTLMGHEVVPVELGRRNGSQVELQDGLDVGDSISLVDLETERPS